MSCTLLVAKSSWMLSLTLTYKKLVIFFKTRSCDKLKIEYWESVCEQLEESSFQSEIGSKFDHHANHFRPRLLSYKYPPAGNVQNMSSPALRRVAGRRGQQPWKGSETPSLEALPWKGFPAPPLWRCPGGQPQACTLASGSGYRMVLPSLVWR